MIPPTTTGTPSSPSLRMRPMTSRTSGKWLPDRIERPTTCTASSVAARTLGAVGVPVETGLADQQLDAASEPRGHALYLAAHVVEPVAGCGHACADARRRAIFTVDGAQRGAPLARRHAGLGAGDRGLHDVAALARGALQLGERGLRGLGVARGA